jgi:predicted MFS family arabinose efflux permease
MLLWSFMTAISGLAVANWQLILARIGVGCGEAAGAAPSHAIVSSHFARRERAKALSVLNLGSPIGIFLGVLIGGWLAHSYGWRFALVAASVPGLIVAALLHFTVEERQPEASVGDQSNRSLAQDVASLFSRPSYAWTIIAGIFSSFVMAALVYWVPTFFGRVHAMSVLDVGLWIGTINGAVGVAGMLLGGYVASRLVRKGYQWTPWWCAIALILTLPCLVVMLLAPSKAIALLGMTLGFFFYGSTIGPHYSIYQIISPRETRSLATAIHHLCTSFTGTALGSLLVGFVTDLLEPQYGSSAIRYALLIPSLACIAAASSFLFAARSINADIEPTLE